MRKLFTFMLLAAALLISVPSWAYVEGEMVTLGDSAYDFPLIGTYSTTNDFGTICLPGRIVATQGINIYDVVCVDVLYSDSTKVARLVVDVHAPCYGWTQYNPQTDSWYWAEPFCPEAQGTAYGYEGSNNPCEKKVYIDWVDWPNEDNPYIDHRMVAGASYFYTVCGNADSLADRKVWVDTNDVATAPVCQNGFYGTFEETTISTPVTVLTKDLNTGTQYLEQTPSATIPANRGYFKGNFECVPRRWNTDIRAESNPYPSSDPNPLRYPCTGEVIARSPSPSAVAFNVGPRDVTTGLYPIDFEHPIYLNKETNKRIENGQLIIETADGTKYNAFGQRVE